jgi:hypothetical protein
LGHSLIGGVELASELNLYRLGVYYKMTHVVPLSPLSITVVGLQILGVVSAWAGVDYINPMLGGGSMLNNG